MLSYYKLCIYGRLPTQVSLHWKSNPNLQPATIESPSNLAIYWIKPFLLNTRQDIFFEPLCSFL